MSELDLFRNLTVLSLEQATILPFLTYRLAQDGARVIRVENPQRPDPNRFVGRDALGEEGMNTYFLPNNCGKQAITLNLATGEGQTILHDLVRELPVDIFASNLRPRSYQKLGIDYDTLRRIKPDIIWLGITGFGPESDEAAYDPILQARAGLMALTGEPDGNPQVFGLPMADLGTAEHAYGQVMKALFKRAATGEGSRVDISMFQSTVSWLVNPVMLTKSFDEQIRRRGNTHQFFAPVSVYPTADGHVYFAVGNDRQWEAITGLPDFAHLRREEYARNAGRIADVGNLNRAIVEVTKTRRTEEWIALFQTIGVPISKVNAIADVIEDPHVRGKLIRAVDPRTGQEVHLPPAPVDTGYLRSTGSTLTFPPRLGEHNEAIYGEVLGYGPEQLADLKARGVI